MKFEYKFITNMFKQLVNYYRYLVINILYGIHVNELSLQYVQKYNPQWLRFKLI